MAWLNLELYDSSQKPMSNRRYTLDFGTRREEGLLDEYGRLSAQVPDGARRASLIVAYRRIDLVLGPLPGANTVLGAQERLNQLNFFVGDVDGDHGLFTRRGLQRFQESCELEPTGELDDETAAHLAREHGA